MNYFFFLTFISLITVSYLLPIDSMSTRDDLELKRHQLIQRADSLSEEIDALIDKLNEKPILHHILINRLRNDKLIMVTLVDTLRNAKTEFVMEKLEIHVTDVESAIEQYLKIVENDIGFVPTTVSNLATSIDN